MSTTTNNKEEDRMVIPQVTAETEESIFMDETEYETEEDDEDFGITNDIETSCKIATEDAVGTTTDRTTTDSSNSNNNDLPIALFKGGGSDNNDETTITIECDPPVGNKPPYHHCRLRCYVVLGIVGILVLGLVSVAAIWYLDDTVTDNPTTMEDVDEGTSDWTDAPTSMDRESIGIQQELEKLIPTNKLYDTTSPYYKAMQWIIHDDERQLQPEDPLLIQRYVLVYLYYETTQHNVWTRCNPPEKDSEDNVCYLNRNGSNRHPSHRWLSTDLHECSWAGIDCDDLNQTTSLSLANRGITGTVPTEITFLPYLRHVDMSYNTITGTIPQVLFDNTLKHLEVLYLYQTELSGTIPNSIHTLHSLRMLSLGHSYLTGTVPATFVQQIPNLQFISLDSNLFTGGIPTQVGTLTDLRRLRWDRNTLEGTLPTELGLLTNCHEMSLDHNIDIVGSIPSEMGLLTALYTLQLQFTSLQGELPMELSRSTQLRTLDLSNTELSGTLPTELGMLSQLRTLHLHNATLYGTIPNELGQLSMLEYVSIQANHLTGTIPKELCDPQDKSLALHKAVLTMAADCAPTPPSQYDTGSSYRPAAVTCPQGCCSTCCIIDTDTCYSTQE